MARCDIFSYAVPLNHAGGQGKVVHMCQTHNMEVYNVHIHGLCPIGRIEEATELAIARIMGAMPPAK